MITLADNRTYVYQWDTGVELNVADGCSQVHFANKIYGSSIDVKVENGKATIPDVLLQSDRDLWAWGFVGSAEKGYTKFEKKIEVKRRNKPADYVFTPPKQTTLEEISEELSEQKEKIEELQEKITDEKIGEKVYQFADDFFKSIPADEMQSDHSENDATKKAYIKNRTHWVEKGEEIVNGVVVKNNNNIQFLDMTNKLFICSSSDQPVDIYINGKKYTVDKWEHTLDGDFYNYNDGNIRFMVVAYSIAGGITFYDETFVGADISITYPEKVEKMPEKFMPELKEIILMSATAGSTKKFKITVDDTGTINVTEV